MLLNDENGWTLISQYGLNDHIYLAESNNDLIILDTKRDKYSLCSSESIKILLVSLLKRNLDLNLDTNIIKESINQMLKMGIISKKPSNVIHRFEQRANFEHPPNIDWRLPFKEQQLKFSLPLLKCLFAVVQVHLYMKLFGFHYTLSTIKKKSLKQQHYFIPHDEQLKELANILNQACLLFPKPTKCLEWAMAFVILGLEQRWKCNLEIGVQNYPFIAHAWVECNGRVVEDEQTLRETLAIILKEPFEGTRS